MAEPLLIVPSAEERVEERVCCPENGDPEPFWGMVFQVHAEELVSDAYRDGAAAERAALVAMLSDEHSDFRRRVTLAISAFRATEVGGCFKPEQIPQGECADGDCYCWRQCGREAAGAMDAVILALSERGDYHKAEPAQREDSSSHG